EGYGQTPLWGPFCSSLVARPPFLLFQGWWFTCQLVHHRPPSLLPQGPPPISFSQAINLETEMGLLLILWPLFFFLYILCCGSSHPSLRLCVCFFKC
uniref:Uncharacterized protein n=1 Tax=Suricata suricatta TaxID=37032 RepID=A0A673VKU1_SURSU